MNEDIKKIKESIMKQIAEFEKRTDSLFDIENVKIYTESIAALSAALAAFATVEHIEILNKKLKEG